MLLTANMSLFASSGVLLATFTGIAIAADPPAVGGNTEAAVVVRFPHRADLWDAALSSDGRVQVVYSVKAAGQAARGASDLFYVATTDARRDHWTEPRSVPTGDLPATIGGERQALIAVLPDGALVVSWPSRGKIGAARSTDGGGSWMVVTPRDPQAAGHADTMTMSDGRTGKVAVAWNDTGVMGRGDDELAAPLHVAFSMDGGATFAPAFAINDDLPGACVCCTPDVAFDDAGQLWVAYRTSTSNVKEICVARVDADGAVSGSVASHDDWHLKGCPMNGPELAVSGDGRTVEVTWTRDADIRSAVSDDGGRTFGAVRELGRGSYHNGAASGESVWMMWERHGQVALRRANAAGEAEVIAVDPQAVLLVTAEGRALVVSDMESNAPRH